MLTERYVPCTMTAGGWDVQGRSLALLHMKKQRGPHLRLRKGGRAVSVVVLPKEHSTALGSAGVQAHGVPQRVMSRVRITFRRSQ
jgi:hypothetical protein